MRPDAITREECVALDRRDPLAEFRDAFVIPEGVIYLDGNSLGAMAKAAPARAARVVEHEWGSDLIRSWNNAGWFELPLELGDKLAPLIGADAGEVVVTDTTSVNLFKLLWAAADMRPGRRKIILEGSNFPTDNYVAQGVAAARGLEVVLVERDAIADAIDEDTLAISITHVHYKTGHINDMAALTARAHAAGALAIWDLCHSAGALPVDLNGCNVDLAVGCTYKYLNGGPGSPAFLFVAKRHLATARQPITGWWGHADPFALTPGYAPAPDIRHFLTGTQPIVSLSLVGVGADLMRAADMTRVRTKSIALTETFIALVEQRCAAHGFTLVSPRDANERGSQVSFAHPHGYAIMRALIDRGVIGDFRAPDIVRFGFTPLYVRFADVWDAVDVLVDVMESGAWRDARYAEREAVT
ncbi:MULTISPECIES: kynureninase [Sphingomonas]|uniref:Kynureninase n=1 Tax=Sphingomonas lycopersici TaxID=2951807 RepID=A0AA42CSB8_9SPHN|nr:MULTISPECIES: kynureninase [Sphingomonas]MCW6532179.1 kynureninase [Sphingomonas lycopersici]MCW6537092.1 kynureninase [Sphingomonas lycopersici]OJU23630.1 MAG: kynureninase [Sphingomonas sp. 66-10]